MQAGFSSLLASVLGHLQHAEDMRRIPIVDWGYYKNKYSDAPFDNTWRTFFEEVSNYSLVDITPFDDVIIRDDEPGNVLFPYYENATAKKTLGYISNQIRQQLTS